MGDPTSAYAHPDKPAGPSGYRARRRAGGRAGIPSDLLICSRHPLAPRGQPARSVRVTRDLRRIPAERPARSRFARVLRPGRTCASCRSAAKLHHQSSGVGFRSPPRPVASAYAHAWTSGGCRPAPVRMGQICSRWAFPWWSACATRTPAWAWYAPWSRMITRSASNRSDRRLLPELLRLLDP